MKKKKSKCIIKNIDMEKISQQADIIAGLSHVFTLYLDSTGTDKHLNNALDCLSNISYKHRDDCNALMKRLSNNE